MFASTRINNTLLAFSQSRRRRELLQKNVQLESPKDAVHTAYGVLPSIMSMIRTPAKLSMCASPEMAANTVAGSSAAHCAVFPFVTRKVDYEVLCMLGESLVLSY